ncbi:DNA-binding protein [Streptomyces sp. NPDC004539]|uniref:DNA-binding protein n=1 Tax=Streptomyces sp. NPDC004539 TaxID=3154280 RepID=UPI0033A0FE6B
MSGRTQETNRELLAAGAVLPLGTENAGEGAVPLTARSYTHPGLADRVVVRLVAGELGEAEDIAAGYLGLVPEAEPVEVGLGARQSLGFPEWVLVHHPEDGHHALDVVPELERIARLAKSRPKPALDAYREVAARLAAAVPHFLSTFYEQAARVFLTAENPTYAGQLFTRARRAEAEHGLPVDESRLDAVFLEFALAGALTASALSGYAKELAVRVPPSEALRRFARLCVRRTAGGLVPSAQLARDVRRLARAAGEDGKAVEEEHLADLLALPATAKAAPGWWKTQRTAVVTLVRRQPALRGTLLSILPAQGDRDVLLMWLDMLAESGALAGLWDDSLPDTERPQDGTAGWFTRFLAFQERTHGWREPTHLPALYPLVERCADRLRTELTASGKELSAGHDLDLLDLLIALDIPAVVFHAVELHGWAKHENRRDLRAFAADDRFRDAFHKAADMFDGDEDDLDTLRVLAQSPGGRPRLADWVREVARRSAATGLPGLPDALKRLKWLPAEALRLAPDEIRAVAVTDLAPLLARTLRAGLLDELGWPAWESAARDLVPGQDVEDLYVADAWPHLVTAGAAQARVIGAEGVVLVHDLRLPAHGTSGHVGFHYVDGELLVHWLGHDDGLRGYWHRTPGRVLELAGAVRPRGTRMNWYREDNGVPSLPLPGGGRTTGAGMLRRGDTALPEEACVIGDGTSYWVWGDEGWIGYDPAAGRLDRIGVPAFAADSPFSPWMLAPYPFDEVTPAGAPVGGLLGWNVTTLPDGAWCGEDLAGRRVTVPKGRGMPYAAVLFPGADRPVAAVREGWHIELVDAEGVVTASAEVDGAPGDFAAGTPILPPLAYWHCLRPRDVRGSEALRRVSDETARELLRARELTDAVGELLPEVTDAALRAGVVGVLRYAVEQQEVLDAASARLTAELAGVQEDEGPAGPSDRVLREALSGFDGVRDRWYHYTAERDNAFRRLRVLRRALGTGEGRASGPHAAEGSPDGGGLAHVPCGEGDFVRIPGEGDDLAHTPHKQIGLAHTSHEQIGPARAPHEQIGPARAPHEQIGPARAPHKQSDPTPRLHLDGPELPSGYLDRFPLPGFLTSVAYRAASPTTSPEHREALVALLREFDALGMASGTGPARWRRVALHVEASALRTPNGEWREGSWEGVLLLDGGAFLAVTECTSRDQRYGCGFTALFHDPAGRFEAPAPYTVEAASPIGEDRAPGWPAEFLAELDERGPAPWMPEAAEEFARLTGVTSVMARLVVAGLPQIDNEERSFLTAPARAVLGVKAPDAALAKDELAELGPLVRTAVVTALLPRDPARLWTHGPEATAAAHVWNDRVGKRTPLPEALLRDVRRALRAEPATLAALLAPASDPHLAHDLDWTVTQDRATPLDGDATGFTAATLVDTVTLTAWLAHHLPAGDPVRATLPAALTAIHDRLSHPGLLLDLGTYVHLPGFRRAVGSPTETTTEYECYGAVVMPTYDDRPAPALRVAHLDETGHDPRLPALRLEQDGAHFPAEVALRIARTPGFAALLKDPGDPPAGARDKNGTWYPQDPTRSVPDLVRAVAQEYGIGEDPAALYLMLLAMPDPTDRTTARWTGWRPARLEAARAALAATDLVVSGARPRAGRSLFLPGAWEPLPTPRLPLERWKLALHPEQTEGGGVPLNTLVPAEPAPDLYRRAWGRIREGDVPRFEELRGKGGRR